MSRDEIAAFGRVWRLACCKARFHGERFAVVEMGGVAVPLALSLVMAHERALAVTMAPLFMGPEEEE